MASSSHAYQSTGMAARSEGQRAILTGLRHRRKVSQAELAQALGFTPSAVSRLVQKLSRDNMVFRIGHGPSTAQGGRPPTYLQMNHEARVVLAAYVSVNQIHFARVNMAFMVDHLQAVAKPARMPADELVDRLVEGFRQHISAEQTEGMDPVAGCCVLLGGPVNYDKGVIADSRNVSTPEEEFPLRDRLARAVKKNVVIDSEVSASLAGEMWLGAGHQYDHTVYVYYDERGPAVSFYLNGQIYRGAAGPAGQADGYFFDHTAGQEYVRHEGRLLPAVALSANEASQVPANTFIELIPLACRDGNAEARRVLEGRLDLLACGLVNFCNLFCPEAIILGGHLVDLDEEALAFVQDRMQKDAQRSVHVSHTRIIRGQLPFFKAIFAGGASHLFHRWFERTI